MEHRQLDETWALNVAIETACKSSCQSKRGVIVWNRELGCVGKGFNSPPKPLLCDGSDKCKSNCSKTAIHAEQRAVYQALQSKVPDIGSLEIIHVKVVDGKAVPSGNPSCWQCSKLILEVGIPYVWLLHENGPKRYTALDFHEQTLKNNSIEL